MFSLKTEQLLDRYINVYLKKTADAGRYDPDTIAIECPVTGCKPKILVQAEVLPGTQPGMNARNFMVTLFNFADNVDVSVFKYIEAECGYRSVSVRRVFSGEITNMYPEAPNPNGALVIQCQQVSNTALIQPRDIDVTAKDPTKSDDDNYLSLNDYDLFKAIKTRPKSQRCYSLLEIVIEAIEEGVKKNSQVINGRFSAGVQSHINPSDIPDAWKEVVFLPLNANLMDDVLAAGRKNAPLRKFASVSALIATVNSEMVTIAKSQNLSPLSLYVDSETTKNAYGSTSINYHIRLSTSEKVVNMASSGWDTIVLDTLSSAYMEGYRGVTTGPWNPYVDYGSQVIIPASFFKTRINITNFFVSPEDSDMWSVLTISIKFSTESENQMQLECINQHMQGRGRAAEAAANKAGSANTGGGE